HDVKHSIRHTPKAVLPGRSEQDHAPVEVEKLLLASERHAQRERANSPLRLLFFFAYSRSVPNRQCRVSFTDSERITHCAEVAAESPNEAAVLALAEFDRCGLTDAHTGPATRLTIAVLAPSTSHEISVGRV